MTDKDSSVPLPASDNRFCECGHHRDGHGHGQCYGPSVKNPADRCECRRFTLAPWSGDREAIGVDGSLHRSVLDLCERVGLVLVDVRDVEHLSRRVLVFRDLECMTEITIEDKELDPISRRCLCGPPRERARKAGDQKIVAAGVFHEGVVYRLPPPARHHNVFEHMRSVHGVDGHIRSDDTGFILEDGSYVRRRAAERIAFKTGQVTKIIGGVLTSEDLW